MKNKWGPSLLQTITKGHLHGSTNWVATTFTHDSRQLTPGQMYVAIKGETVDGHAYVADALNKGAAAALVDHVPNALPADAPLLVVENIEQALMDIGRYVRDHTHATFIGVTGSSGKTTTKDMLNLCLSQQGKSHANFRSFNSRWGVPLTLAECAGDEDYVILEMGMSAKGELSRLTSIAKPHIALITTINPAHIDQLGTIENIARAKSEIFEGVPKTGVAILPGDLPETPILLEKAKKESIENIFLFGEGAHCDFKLLSYTPIDSTAHITISLQGKIHAYTLGLLGRHFAMNSLAVLGAIHAAKASVPQAIKALETFQGSERRGQILPLKDNILLFDESYNANPGSMNAALEAFGARPIQGHKYLVLGDMRALGKDSKKYHKDLKEAVLATKPQAVFTYGDEMKALHTVIKKSVTAHHYTDLEPLIKDVLKTLKKNDAVMIKASNSVNLNRVAEAVRKKGAPAV